MQGVILLGTASDVGKTMIATAFCRLFASQGKRVAPFKSQNLSPFTEPLPTEGEISRAQYIQAIAAQVTPSIFMNPIMLKPTRSMHAHVTILGEPFGTHEGFDFREHFFEQAVQAIRTSLQQLATQVEMVVIEGAGSPAEVNLQDREIVNMRVAEIADVPAILVADISKGGAIAAIVGTLALLPKDHRNRVKGIIVNRFHGDITRFQEGIEAIEHHTNIPVLGVIPELPSHGIQEEDQHRPVVKNAPPLDEAIDRFAHHVKNYVQWEKVERIVMRGDDK